MTHVLSAVAWPYANGPRHIGHVAGFGVPSDVFSRYMRMAGHEVLMVSGTDEHGTPILVTADKEGVQRQGPRRQQQRGHRQRPRRPRPVLRPLHPHHDRQPLRRRAGDVPHRAGQRLHGRADHPGRHQPVDRAHPARPLHRGHLPDLRVRRRARRPVRQLRQPARRHRPDRPAVEDQRGDAGLRRHPALPARPARARRGAGGVARRARGQRHVAAQRHQVQPEHPQGDPAARDDPRHRLGHPGAGLGGPADQAALRLVRRGHRLPLGLHRVGPPPRRAGQVARVVERPATPCPTTSWARTTSSSTPRSGPPSCSPTTARARAAASRGSTACSTCRPRSSPRSTSRWATSSSPPRAATCCTSGTSWTATAPTRCATSSARPGPRPPTRPSRGPTSSPATTPSWSPAGATWSTGRPR